MRANGSSVAARLVVPASRTRAAGDQVVTQVSGLRTPLGAAAKSLQAQRSLVGPVVLAGTVAVVALSLRPAITSVGAMLGEIQATTGMSSLLGTAVVSAPVWCLAAGGVLGGALHTLLGLNRALRVALLVLALALAGRVLGGQWLLFDGTVVACLAIAVLSTLLPAVVRGAPAGLMTTLMTCHTTAMGGGSAVGALLTPYLAEHSSLRLGIGGWALLAAVGWVVWVLGGGRLVAPVAAATPAVRRVNALRLRPVGTIWALTLHLGLVCGATFSVMGWLTQILREHGGLSTTSTRWLYIVAMTLGVPFAVFVPKLARWRRGQSWLAVLLGLPSLLGLTGLLVAPAAAPIAWAICLGLGMVAVVLAIGLITLRAGSQQDAVGLSSLVHCAGFMTAGVVTVAIGAVHSVSGSWQWPLTALVVVVAGQMLTGMLAGRPMVVAVPVAT